MSSQRRKRRPRPTGAVGASDESAVTLLFRKTRKDGTPQYPDPALSTYDCPLGGTLVVGSPKSWCSTCVLNPKLATACSTARPPAPSNHSRDAADGWRSHESGIQKPSATEPGLDFRSERRGLHAAAPRPSHRRQDAPRLRRYAISESASTRSYPGRVFPIMRKPTSVERLLPCIARPIVHRAMRRISSSVSAPGAPSAKVRPCSAAPDGARPHPASWYPSLYHSGANRKQRCPRERREGG